MPVFGQGSRDLEHSASPSVSCTVTTGGFAVASQIFITVTLALNPVSRQARRRPSSSFVSGSFLGASKRGALSEFVNYV